MSIINAFKYRPEIDGLRALAVLAVLFYHVGLGFPGGFVGVDIFFVISGFLITSLIIKEIQENRFSFLNFYERRIRRIFPAGAVMVLITFIMGWFLLLPSDFIGLGKSIISQTFFSSNIYFWRNTNYFAESADIQPLLHTWSLSVEEQFYMIMPLFLWGLFKLIKVRSRITLASVILIIFILSFVLSVYTLPNMPGFTFYLLPTRAWELLVGSLVALVPPLNFLKRPAIREFVVALGLLGMILPIFFYTKETLFPGVYAIPPCLGAALFIIGASPQLNNTLPFAAKIFTLRPVVFTGLISYSLYLWHWPLVAFSKYWALEEFSTTYKWSIVACSLVLAFASWRYVETPFREKKLAKGRRETYSYAVSISILFIMAGSYLYFKDGFSERFDERVIAYENARPETLKGMSSRLLPLDANLGNFPTFGIPQHNIHVLVWGDSHAGAILPAVIEAAGENFTIGSAWTDSTPPLLNFIPQGEFSLGEKGPAWAEAIVAQIRKKKIPNVVLAARWDYYLTLEAGFGNTDNKDGLREDLLTTIRSLVESGTKVYILKEVPNQHVSVPKALAKEIIFGADLTNYICSKDQLMKQNEIFNSHIKDLELAGATILDASELLLDKTRGMYRIKGNNLPLYYDRHHLTGEGARYVAEIFKPIFSQFQTEKKFAFIDK